MPHSDWAGARTAWEEQFAGRKDAPEASWELARIEECEGDSFFFAEEAGAAPHYHAACAALAPPGAQWDSREENDRRMEAHARVTAKLYAIDPYGKARPSHDGRPHPDFRPPDRREESPEPAPRVEPLQQSRAEMLQERRAAALHLRSTNFMQQTDWAALFRDSGHWQFYTLGGEWRQAGEALAASYPEAARRAFRWSVYYYECYNRDWTAHLPASRWDTDGGQDLMEVQELIDSLPGDAPGAPLPEWIEHLLDGNWRQALDALSADRPPEFRPLISLLDEACRAAGIPGLLKDAGTQ
jgi:hypothetical protein